MYIYRVATNKYEHYSPKEFSHEDKFQLNLHKKIREDLGELEYPED